MSFIAGSGSTSSFTHKFAEAHGAMGDPWTGPLKKTHETKPQQNSCRWGLSRKAILPSDGEIVEMIKLNRLSCLNPFLKYPGWEGGRWRYEDRPYSQALTPAQRRKILGPVLSCNKWWMFPKVVRRILSRPCSETVTEQFVVCELGKAGFELARNRWVSRGKWSCGGLLTDNYDLVFKDGLFFSLHEAIDWLRGVI